MLYDRIDPGWSKANDEGKLVPVLEAMIEFWFPATKKELKTRFETAMSDLKKNPDGMLDTINNSLQELNCGRERKIRKVMAIGTGSMHMTHTTGFSADDPEQAKVHKAMNIGFEKYRYNAAFQIALAFAAQNALPEGT